jgi:hypothetical protein
MIFAYFPLRTVGRQTSPKSELRLRIPSADEVDTRSAKTLLYTHLKLFLKDSQYSQSRYN